MNCTDNPPTGDNGKPHIVLEEDQNYLRGLMVDCCGGVVPRGEFSAGKVFVKNVSEEYDLYLEKNARKAILAYLILAGYDEFILHAINNPINNPIDKNQERQ